MTAASAAGVDLLLLTDADIAHHPPSVRRPVATALADDRDLVSLMALLRTQTGWERALVPTFVYFFAQLYLFRRVAQPGARTAAAAGGCALRRHAIGRSGAWKGRVAVLRPIGTSHAAPLNWRHQSFHNAR